MRDKLRITKEEVEYVAQLARLELSEGEKGELAVQLSRILEYAEKINRLDTEGVEPTAHAVPMKNVFREDEVHESLSTDDVLANAPEREGDYFKVPRILEA